MRAAAASAVRAGYTVHAADLFGDVDLRRISCSASVADYPRGLANTVRGLQPGGWMYTGALENHSNLIDVLARARPLLGNSGSVLRRSRDPWEVARILHASGLNCPAIQVSPGASANRIQWLRKPIKSAGGAQVSFANASDGDRARGAFYLQEFIVGPSYSAVYLAVAERATLLGITRQLVGMDWAGASGFRYSGSILDNDLSSRHVAEFAIIGEALTQALGLVGLFGVDAIVNASGVWPVEINPRYTASAELFDWAHGISTSRMHIAACQSSELPLEQLPALAKAFGKAILYTPERFVVAEELQPCPIGRGGGSWPDIADIPVVGTVIEAGSPVVTMFAKANCEKVVIEQLKLRAVQLREQLGINAATRAPSTR